MKNKKQLILILLVVVVIVGVIIMIPNPNNGGQGSLLNTTNNAQSTNLVNDASFQLGDNSKWQILGDKNNYVLTKNTDNSTEIQVNGEDTVLSQTVSVKTDNLDALRLLGRINATNTAKFKITLSDKNKENFSNLVFNTNEDVNHTIQVSNILKKKDLSEVVFNIALPKGTYNLSRFSLTNLYANIK